MVTAVSLSIIHIENDKYEFRIQCDDTIDASIPIRIIDCSSIFNCPSSCPIGNQQCFKHRLKSLFCRNYSFVPIIDNYGRKVGWGEPKQVIPDIKDGDVRFLADLIVSIFAQDGEGHVVRKQIFERRD